MGTTDQVNLHDAKSVSGRSSGGSAVRGDDAVRKLKGSSRYALVDTGWRGQLIEPDLPTSSVS
ncbi:hypothetical protein NKI82_33030 [Mesorhizobium sp. M0482]|uniref:hypothetical protein n=1 Tax=Mesorhizobium sp. M0482 TaxID=2956948 RepID=UPI00333AC33B